MAPPRLACGHSHLFPGAWLSGQAVAGPVEIAFADGPACPGHLSDGILDTPGHVTAAGTRVAARRWRLAPISNGWKVQARVCGAAGDR